MSDPKTLSHPGFDRLLEYWLDETDDAATQAIDLHLLACDACSSELDEIAALSQGVRGAFVQGLVSSFVSPGFVAQLVGRGVRVREYRIPCGGSVNCSVAPDDDLVVSRLQAPLEGVSRIDVAARMSFADREERLHDVPFDAGSGEVVFAPPMAEVRRLPAHVLHIRLLAVEHDGEREIGNYVLNHSPWREQGRGA